MLWRDILILLTVCFAEHLSSQYGRAQQISCITENTCNRTDSAVMADSVKDCCQGVGHFYIQQQSPICQPCIVFGWLNGTRISLPEQAESSILTVGFLKGASTFKMTQLQLNFRVIRTDGTARHGDSLDYTVSTTTVEIDTSFQTSADVQVFIRVDRNALERPENFSLTLEGDSEHARELLRANVMKDNVSIFPTIEVIIEDTETALLQFTESDYSNVESALRITTTVQLLTSIATPLTVELVPVNYTDVNTTGKPLPQSFPRIPAYNPRRPTIANSFSEQNEDFSIIHKVITFAGNIELQTIDINIADDDVTEMEEIFVIYLEVVDAINPGKVDLQTGRFATLARILDDDAITIGFTQTVYTFNEGIDFFSEIPIIKGNNRKSEITFSVRFSLSFGNSANPAALNDDFLAAEVQSKDFDPDEQSISFVFEVIDDFEMEATESFDVELSMLEEDLFGVNVGARGSLANGLTLFSRTRVIIIDNDGSAQQVSCFTETDGSTCNRTDSAVTADSVKDCCQGVGHFYIQQESPICQPCIAFGWLNGTRISLPEQAESSILTVGFLKGASTFQMTQLQLNFRVMRIDGTARHGDSLDYIVLTTTVEIDTSFQTSADVQVFIRVDRNALERPENLSLTLEGDSEDARELLRANLDNVYILPTIEVVIEDTETALLQFTQSDYADVESALRITTTVQLLTSIATPLTVELVPVNYTDVNTTGKPLPQSFPRIPEYNPRRPTIANSFSEQNEDFSTMRKAITFARNLEIQTIDIDIDIVDDDVHELEEIFVICLEVVDAINPGKVDLQTGRFATLARILDDDAITIGFTQTVYTFSEGMDFISEIPIIKGNNRQTEITFSVRFSLSIGNSANPAALNVDFLAAEVQSKDFNPDEQSISFVFEVIDDSELEATESFDVELSILEQDLPGVNAGGSLANGLTLFNRVSIFIIDDDATTSIQPVSTSPTAPTISVVNMSTSPGEGGNGSAAANDGGSNTVVFGVVGGLVGLLVITVAMVAIGTFAYKHH